MRKAVLLPGMDGPGSAVACAVMRMCWKIYQLFHAL